MPFSLSHPAAVIPLFRLTGRSILAVALIVGSVSPDFGYYFRLFSFATFAHSLIGSLVIGVPSGVLLLCFLILARKPLLWLMPSRVRAILRDSLAFPRQHRLTIFAKVAWCVWVGSLTHNVWDSFTHKSGWFVEHVHFLRSSILLGEGYSFSVYYLLQQVSTVMGLIIVVIFAFRVFSRLSPVGGHDRGDLVRYVFWMTLVVLSICLAVPFAVSYAAHVDGLLQFRTIVFQTGIRAGAIFATLSLVSLAIVSLREKR